jgi:hypothetical protein
MSSDRTTVILAPGLALCLAKTSYAYKIKDLARSSIYEISAATERQSNARN